MMRKVLTSFLIIYIVVLLTQPCEDIRADSLDVKSTVAEISVPTPPEREPVSETCSPFCVCGCCSLSVAHHGFTTLAMTDGITIIETTLTPIYQTAAKRTYVDSIWQPPKV